MESIEGKGRDSIVQRSFSKSFKGDEKDNFRGSKFRGISKNGNQWQVLLMFQGQKKYFGTLKEEIEAARFYDRVSIQYHGIKAKTNFNYTKEEVMDILAVPLIKAKQ